MSKSRRQIILQAIKDTVKGIVPEGSEVILFGSRARGDAKANSDWDVLIILDKDRVTRQDMDDFGYPLWERGLDFNENINTIFYTKNDWHRRSASPFVENVTEEGIKLWG